MRILCLGNNTEDTDLQTRALATQAQMLCHGLLSELDRSFSTIDYSQPGYYHSSVVDLQPGNLKKLINQFDKAIMLDQPIEQWNHPHEFYNTIAFLKSATIPVEFLNPESAQPAEFFNELIKHNKSFCIFPFIELHTTHNHTQLCCRSSKPVKNLNDLTDFNTDPDYQRIRESMLKGEMLPDFCSDCYNRESKGIISARQSETPEWVYRLGIKNLEDLKNVKKPAFYDLRPGNKCNLLCRSCNPDDSHLIAKEYKKLKITSIHRNYKTDKHQSNAFELIEFDNISKLLVAGGEPTIMPEFFKFLEKCIALGNTDFEINVTTNGTNLSDRLKKLVKQFKDFSWVFSIDGYKELNYYSRYPSSWNNIVDNWHYHLNQKNPVTVNTTISIYNIDSLDKLFSWMDQAFPNTLISCMALTGPIYLDPLLFPDRDAALQSLERVMRTNCYKNSDILASTVDSLYQQFQDRIEINEPVLKEFFKFNDLLDSNRNIHLRDYVPVLEKYREKYVS
jgi:sulfatase maturation enzyme AslB (radical SAM superfamily)